MFAGGRRVNLNLFAACIHVTLLQHPLLKQEKVRVCRELFFQICYEYKVRRVNNILIIGHLRDTDIIRQCIHNQTNLIYYVNPIDPSRFNNKLPCSPDDPAKWEKYGCRRFDNFTFFLCTS